MRRMKGTHGEVWWHKKCNINLKDELDDILRDLSRLPKRMNRSEASAYYNAKLRSIFGVPESKGYGSVKYDFDEQLALRMLPVIKKVSQEHRLKNT